MCDGDIKFVGVKRKSKEVLKKNNIAFTKRLPSEAPVNQK